MDSITITDGHGDTLHADIQDGGDYLYVRVEDRGDSAELSFGHEQESAVRNLRSYITEWLGESDPLVRASEVSFNEGLMRLAAVHGKTVTFRYAKGGGAVIETRVLKPENVQQVGDHVTFTGYDPDRDEPRAYRVDRIKGEVSVA